MKKIIFTFVLATITTFLTAQNFQGEAVYESKTSTTEFMKNIPKNRNITPEIEKMIEQRMKKMFEKTFVLTFNKEASIYKEEEKLELEKQRGSMMMNFANNEGTFYKNIKKQQYTVDRDIFGKEFLIIDTLQQIKWQLSSETKKIGNYTCFKATAVVPVQQSDLKNFRPKRDNREDKTESNEKNKTTNFIDQWEMPKEKTITAWYAPEIPITQGPSEYWGLPGLILEVSDGKTTILCSKIVMNSKTKKEIKAPKKGKKVTQKEFDKLMLKKIEEMREMRRGQRGRPPRF